MSLDQSFRNLTADERARLATSGSAQTFASGEEAVREGQDMQNLMVVTKGMLRVTHVYTGKGLSEFSGPLGPGDVVGEMSFVDGQGASATLIADGDTEVLVIPRSTVNEMMAADPSFSGRFYLDLILHLSHRLRATNLRADPGPTPMPASGD